MTSPAATLSQKSLLVIFAYAPAGLGHLRVTDALYDGLPESVSPLLLGSQDTGIAFIHRLFSIDIRLRHVFEWLQYNPQQYVFRGIYYHWLRLQTKLMYQQLTTVIDQRVESIDTVLVVATYFGLAHQIGAIKKRVEQEKKVKIVLAVQVTDDSPQFMWYVPEADITFAPSRYTKRELEKYGKWKGLPPIQIDVNAYPLSPLLARRLDHVEMFEKTHQMDPEGKSQIHVCIPISGAAVGLSYFTTLIDTLYKTCHRFIFHVVARSAPYTRSFLDEMIERPYVKLYVSGNDREVVQMYEHVYQDYRISLEVTKPSEQAFKSLLSPQHCGGSLLLLADPVGRQEYDNINFLHRHGLIPTKEQQNTLEMKALHNHACGSDSDTWQEAQFWRGIRLPADPVQAACTTWWGICGGLFAHMMHWKARPDWSATDEIEISPDGVQRFWQKVAEHLSQSNTVCTS